MGFCDRKLGVGTPLAPRRVVERGIFVAQKMEREASVDDAPLRIVETFGEPGRASEGFRVGVVHRCIVSQRGAHPARAW